MPQGRGCKPSVDDFDNRCKQNLRPFRGTAGYRPLFSCPAHALRVEHVRYGRKISKLGETAFEVSDGIALRCGMAPTVPA